LVHVDARPNPAHLALAALERRGVVGAVITQNIDGLHHAAGSQRVIELHGSILRNTCTGCGRRYGLDVVLAAPGVPRCEDCGAVVKPDVVLYEESLDAAVMDAAVDELARADTLIVGGTSLQVYPAAGLVQAFGGDNLVLINRQATRLDRLATLTLREPIGQALAPFADPA
ncbi:MAG: Sir2 family NAD-dependent protein deacetylase, partial [Propionicimonas sp.]